MGDYQLGRRPALDGVRGLAVLAVIGGHSLLPLSTNAGTVGVTVFFVLSGFLITRLLVEEHARTGRISLLAFYRRRCRRLLPGLAIFLLCAIGFLAASASSLLPVAISAGQVANVAMIHEVPMNSLLHMWSLSAEEQFYILWPPVLVMLLRRLPRSRIALTIAALGLASLAWRTLLVLTSAPPQRILYGPDTRADAILIGCLLALCIHRVSSRHAATWASVGFLVLLAAVPLGSVDTWTLFPVAMAAAGVIAWLATTTSRAIPVWVLSSAPLVGLGRISYGVYLWHLPIAVALTDVLPAWQVAAWTIAISTAIATLVWKLVERPVLSRAEPWPRMIARATSMSDATLLTHTVGREAGGSFGSLEERGHSAR